MAAPLLTSLSRVKSWLGITNDGSDVQLLALIKAVSVFVYKYIDLQTVVVTAYSELRSTQGHYWIRPNNWPLISLQSIDYGGISVSTPATGNPAGSGYQITYPNQNMGPARVTVNGFREFPYGKDVLTINYTAGFQQIDELVIAAGTVTLSEFWAADGSVVYTSSGIALTKVTGAPAVGEYSVTDGVYTFNVTENGIAVTITYSYVPADLVHAVTEIVGATMRSAENIGIRSKTLAGQETVSFFQNKITPSQAMLLSAYMRVTPR